MVRLFRYLGKYKGTVAVIVLLLCLQAYCDLSLPRYTSDIVDIGVQQGGIAYGVPVEMSRETWQTLQLLLTQAERAKLQEAYGETPQGTYALLADDQETMEQLDAILELPMVMKSMAAEMGAQAGSEAGAGMELAAGNLTDEQILAIRDKVTESMGSMSESMITQKAVLAVKEEYEAIGLDTWEIQKEYLLTAGMKMLGMTLLMVAASVLAGYFASRTAAGIGRNLRDEVFERVVDFSNEQMHRFSTASLITRSTNDIQQVQMVMVMLLRMVCYAPILGIGGVIRVMQTQTGMSWIIILAVAIILLLVLILMQIAMPKFRLMQTLVDKMNLVSREILTGISVIRAFSRETYEEKRFDGVNRELMDTQLFTNRTMTFMMPVMMLVMNGITVLIVWVGAQGIDLGNLQVGDMMAFITYTMQIVMSFLMLTMISIMLPRAGVAADRIEEVLRTETTIHDKEQVLDDQIGDGKGTIRFEQVSFRYPGADEDVLSDISFTAEAGKTTAIIGSTGSGKSTLLHLIPRFYDVTGGRITLDGVDIRDLSRHKLRSLIGFVPQKGVLFSGDIASNIKFADDRIPDEKMKEAAAIAQAEDFIEEKPEGYHSPISQGGTNVSGGQKQRLSIARAIAKDPKVYLFDDSFSALDFKTDAALRKALKERVRDAAVIIVAQRISTILHADRILVLDEGRLAGIGTHEELLQNCTAYQEIAKSQLSEEELKGGRA